MNILNNFEVRKKYARSILLDICKNPAILGVLGPDQTWAVVGGAVRDCLITEHPCTKILFRPWPDVDVAVASDEFCVDEHLSEIQDMDFSIQHNSFGGWKVSSEDTGELDIWKVKLDRPASGLSERWLSYLDNVDFAINAVAFTWPECEIVVHPRWHDALRKQLVTRLSSRSVKKHFQAIRGVALAVKLQITTGLSFRLGKQIGRDLDWLVGTSHEQVMRESLRYLQHKVSSGRWSFLVLQRFLLESAKRNYTPSFRELIKDTFADDLRGYVKLRMDDGLSGKQRQLW